MMVSISMSLLTGEPVAGYCGYELKFLSPSLHRRQEPRRSIRLDLDRSSRKQGALKKSSGSTTSRNTRRCRAHQIFLQDYSLLFTANMPATTKETLRIVEKSVIIAPLVLLSAADHYGRSAKGTRKRVVGVLLGQNDGKSVRVSNSFAGWYRMKRQHSARG